MDDPGQLAEVESAAPESIVDRWKPVWIVCGLVFVVNGFLADWFISSGGSASDIATVGNLSAMIGAFLLGFPILLRAFRDLAEGKLTTNELVAIAVTASFASGKYPEAGLVAFFMLLAEMIENQTAAGAKASIESLIKLTPTKARRIKHADGKKVNGDPEEVAAQDLRVGDVIEVRAGDNIAADGVILRGESSINQAIITGESLPVDKGKGDEVYQGTTNTTGFLTVEVTKAGEDTTFGRVRGLILAAEKTKLPIEKIVDQYMGFYTPLVLVMGALVWAMTRDLDIVITVFIVTCPVAFVLATPTAIVASLSAAARLGILIKKVSDIELAARINAFVFDKTGTVTTGKLAVSRLQPVENTQEASAELLYFAASAERGSTHPAAKALDTLSKEVGVKLFDTDDFTETPGKGVKATVDNEVILVGRDIWLKENGIKANFAKSVDIDETEGYSLVFVARGKKYIGWVGLSDETREEANSAINGLKEEGVRRVALVSGDRTAVATRVAEEIGCEEVEAECLPEDKVHFVNNVKAKGYKVAVVGDGVNDAPALAAGSIGIAMGAAGSEVAINSATIALMNNDLRRLPFLVRLSRMTRSVINQNFLFGVLFVFGGLYMAWIKLISAVTAAALHVVGSLFVVFNSARLVRQGEELEPIEIGSSGDDSDMEESSEEAADVAEEMGEPVPAK